ncbi:MAG: hypothetical protein J6S28_04025 [Clostridia bacterium]|nr:hypothetical protein [Clostridia bacterium]
MKNQSKSTLSRVCIILYVVLSLCGFAAILIVPASREVFKLLSTSHPYLMGFVKFSALATAGELLALRLAKKDWVLPSYVWARFLIWGIIGVWITYMMKIFGAGVGALMQSGLLPCPENALLHSFVKAFMISATMNLSFGPTFMALHKCSDTYLDMRATGKRHITLANVIHKVDWERFASFTLLKTVPLFWIPAHTVTFMLPAEYQVAMAAALSVALGIILNLKRKKS